MDSLTSKVQKKASSLFNAGILFPVAIAGQGVKMAGRSVCFLLGSIFVVIPQGVLALLNITNWNESLSSRKILPLAGKVGKDLIVTVGLAIKMVYSALSVLWTPENAKPTKEVASHLKNVVWQEVYQKDDGQPTSVSRVFYDVMKGIQTIYMTHDERDVYFGDSDAEAGLTSEESESDEKDVYFGDSDAEAGLTSEESESDEVYSSQEDAILSR